MDNSIVLSPVPLAELLAQFRLIVQEEIKVQQTQEIGERLLSVDETRKVFQPAISRQTLSAWTKAGHIKMQKIGGKCYYRYSDVLQAGKVLKLYKK